MCASVRLPADVHTSLWRHLTSDERGPEEAAFVFANISGVDNDYVFEHIDWFPVPPEGFAWQSALHFELTDEMRATVIKRAHDFGAAIVEFHSHRGAWPAQFSGSDWIGFEEFVPHVRWRLKGRPYGAVVVTPTGFDGLAWVQSSATPIRLRLLANGQVLEPTQISPLTRDGYGLRED